jgi:hypothetical protein
MFGVVLDFGDYSFFFSVVDQRGIEVLLEFIGDILYLIEDVL